MFNLRTDLAIENREIYKNANKLESEIPGVETRGRTRWQNNFNKSKNKFRRGSKGTF